MAVAAGASVTSTMAADSPTEITADTDIENPGTYTITEDIHDEEREFGCIRIWSDHVTIRGNGHRLVGEGEGTGIAAGVWDRRDAEDVVIQNLTIENWGWGIRTSMDGSASLLDVNMRDDDRMMGGPISNGFDVSIYGGEFADNSEGLDVELGRTSVYGSQFVNNDGFVARAAGEVSGEYLFQGVEFTDNETVLVTGTPNTGAHTLVDCTFEQNDTVANLQAGESVAMERCHLRDNTEGIHVGDLLDGGVDVTTTNFEDNGFAVRNETDTDTQATCNWWGDESGPVHPDSPDPDPQGDEIIGNVTFAPWSIRPIDEQYDREDHCVGGIDAVDTIYWQVDFGDGEQPPIPPRYWPDDGMFALGDSLDGATENPSLRRQETAGQLGDVTIHDQSFAFDDADDPREVTVRFELDEDADPRYLHLASFELPGPFDMDEIDDQELHEYTSDRYSGGDSGELTISLPSR